MRCQVYKLSYKKIGEPITLEEEEVNDFYRDADTPHALNVRSIDYDDLASLPHTLARIVFDLLEKQGEIDIIIKEVN